MCSWKVRIKLVSLSLSTAVVESCLTPNVREVIKVTNVRMDVVNDEVSLAIVRGI